MRGQNNCEWIDIGSTEHYEHTCINTFCKIHLAHLRKNLGTKPCKVCGVGVKNKNMLCKPCGYHSAFNKEWQRVVRVFDKEKKRLRTI